VKFVEYLFGASSFVPRGYCLLWRPDLVAMHALSDGVIAASYFPFPWHSLCLCGDEWILSINGYFGSLLRSSSPAAPPILSVP
jgi:hypothetical protein